MNLLVCGFRGHIPIAVLMAITIRGQTHLNDLRKCHVFFRYESYNFRVFLPDLKFALKNSVASLARNDDWKSTTIIFRVYIQRFDDFYISGGSRPYTFLNCRWTVTGVLLSWYHKAHCVSSFINAPFKKKKKKSLRRLKKKKKKRNAIIWLRSATISVEYIFSNQGKTMLVVYIYCWKTLFKADTQRKI